MSFDRLTQSARIRYAELRDAVEATHAAIHALQGNIRSNEVAARNFAGNNDDNKEAQATYIEEIARLQGKLAPLQDRYRVLAGLSARVTTWIQTLAQGALISDAKPVAYEVVDDEQDIERIHRLRSEIEKLEARRKRAAESFLPVPEMRAEVARYVERMVEVGRPSLVHIDDRLEIRSNTGTSAIALLAWNDPEALKESLNLDVERHVAGLRKRGLIEMSAKNRKMSIERYDAEILAMEFEEQFFVASAVETGMQVLQRERADPRAVLGVTLERKSTRLQQAAE